MKAPHKQQFTPPKGGFAIVMVLASLTVLTMVFAITSQRSMTHLHTIQADRHLAGTQADNQAILIVLLAAGRDLTGAPIVLPPPYEEAELRLQDVGGLIDLNTASPALLSRLFGALDFPSDAQTVFTNWRQEGQRLQRVDDLIRITGADPRLLPVLEQVATVHSGRRGVSLEVAPERVKEISGPDDGTVPSTVNFAVYRTISGEERLLGILSYSDEDGGGRVLEVR